MKASEGASACRGMVAALSVAVCVALCFTTACDSVVSSQATVVVGPGLTGNIPPELQFLEPIADKTLGLGENFIVRWTDVDRDSSALISFFLVDTASNEEILLEANVPEDEDPDSRTFDTTLVPEGRYNVLAVISDGSNPPVRVFAQKTGEGVTQRVVLNVTPPGQGPQTEPPRIRMIEPAFDQSVAQDDVLRVILRPAEAAPAANIPYDPDSNVTLYVLLDTDLDPNNDDPEHPDPSQIIVFRQFPTQLAAGDFDELLFDITVDLNEVPPRANGDPYYIRATADDLTNPPVHHYAAGAISVVQLVARSSTGEPIDLFDVGRSKSGARFYGFNAGANLGSGMAHIGDFDADGLDDFVLIAQFGNPRHLGPVGEAYAIYGLDNVRFGGSIAVNSVGESVSGVIFEAPPIRPIVSASDWVVPDARTDGITDVSFITDLTGDGRPELLFGLAHVHGAFEGMDWDPGDDDPTSLAMGNVGCYPDLLVNNMTDQPDGGGLVDVYRYAGGMAVMVNSQNRDNDGLINPLRLERTVVSLELVGQKVTEVVLQGNIIALADNAQANNLGTEQSQSGRISGARFVGGAFDNIDAFDLRQPAREALFGQTVAMLGDQNNNDRDEIMISAPRNERYLADLANNFPVSTHRASTLGNRFGSIMVIEGENYNLGEWRDKDNADNGNAVIPFLDQHIPGQDPYGRCADRDPVARHMWVPAGVFQVFAEEMDDWLGGARSAGDFNRDGIDDIVCGAPRNDRSASQLDTGAAYILYGRNPAGDFHLALADDPDATQRPPMLRIRGLTTGDQIGWEQEGGSDVNGDGIDDVLISSPTADFGVSRTTCHALFYCGQETVQLSSLEFASCKDSGGELFCDDRCKAFDYDNDGDVDDDDEDVFVCLFGGGTNCCEHLVDNGFVAVVFGGVRLTGDRTIAQIGTPDLPGVKFYGSEPGHRAGMDVSSAGDFDRDGFGDILITAPGEMRTDSAGRNRMGVVYLIYGGPAQSLMDRMPDAGWSLDQVGTNDLPGIVLLSPYVAGRPNEAAPTKAAVLGDINNDGFQDIGIGNPLADFIDFTYPQGPEATDSQIGRRPNTGDIYVIYGNNFNRGGF
ncbi:MAG: integrin alpha [Phycisphaerae bacterium]